MKRAVLLLATYLWLSGSLHAQDLLRLRIDFYVQDEPLSQALLILSQESKIPISFSENFLPSGKRVSFDFKKEPVKNILTQLLEDTKLDFKVLNESIILFPKIADTPKRYTISGYVEDSQTGERLIAATVLDLKSGKGTTTNDYGFFSLTLPEGSPIINCSYLGYKAESRNLVLEKNERFTISLKPTLTLTEVVVTAKDTISLQQKLDSREDELSLDVLRAFPQLGGEGDVFRYTHMLPGVQTGADGVGGIHIRGGNADQNLILLDGVPVYNATHAVGVFSIFNSSAVRSARLIKGDFPARYAGRLSSVLDVRTREGNQKSFSAELQAGIVGGRLTLEGPLKKDKGAIFLAGRLAYLNVWLKPYVQSLKEEKKGSGNSDYDFYDLNAKINYSVSPKDKIFLSLYKGGDDYFDESFNRDTFELKTNDIHYSDTLTQALNWGNTIAALRWNRTWNDKLFSNFALTFSNYRFSSIDFSNLNDFDLITGQLLNRTISYQQFNSNIEDQAAKIDFEYFAGEQHKVFFGANLIRHTFQPGVLTSNEISAFARMDNDTIFQNASNVSFESGLYLEDAIRVNENWTANLGLHFAGLHVEDADYWSLQPRISTRYKLNKATALKGSAGKMTQFLHLLTNSDFGLPTDLWVPSTAKIKPEQSWQFTLGLEKNFADRLNIDIEVYYKKLDNMLTFQTGSRLAFIDANNWEENVTVGEGRAYGIDWQIKKTSGKTKAWLNYSLAWSERQFDDINEGLFYPFKYDRRHDLKLIISHQFNKSFEFTANWVYGTGLAFTLATSAFEFVQGPDFIIYNIFQVGEKNALRLPPYHRLDFGFNWYNRKKWGMYTWHLGVYNLYNRSNPLYYRLGRDPDDFLKRRFVQVTILPIFPTLSFTLKLY